MRPLVEMFDLQVYRGQQAALQLDELSITRNEILAVVGPNGAGKSTLLLTLARLLKPSQGRFLFNGQPVEDMADTVYRRRIALVMQDPILFDMSVFDNVASGLRFRGVDSRQIQDVVPPWLEKLGIASLADRRAGELSGGEAQRVSLARAMVLEPDLLLLDEPFSSLDPPTRSRILTDLGDLLKETSVTTVFVTHDLKEVADLAHKMAVIAENRLCQVGPYREILASPVEEAVTRFLNG